MRMFSGRYCTVRNPLKGRYGTFPTEFIVCHYHVYFSAWFSVHLPLICTDTVPSNLSQLYAIVNYYLWELTVNSFQCDGLIKAFRKKLLKIFLVSSVKAKVKFWVQSKALEFQKQSQWSRWLGKRRLRKSHHLTFCIQLTIQRQK